MATSTEALSLYRHLLRYSSKLAAYNFREYALRRTRDAYLANRGLRDEREIQNELSKGWNDFAVLKRQAVISQMYEAERLVVETSVKHHHSIGHTARPAIK